MAAFVGSCGQPVKRFFASISFQTTLIQQGVRAVPLCCFHRNCASSSSNKKDELYRQITVEVKSHDRAVLNSYQTFTSSAAEQLGVNIERIFEPPKVITRKSLLKSVFVHKKHFHQYEARTHYRIFELKHLTGSTASTFLEYIQRNLPEGVAMKVTKHQLHPLPEHLVPPELKSAQEASQSTDSTTTSSNVDTGLTEISETAVSSSPPDLHQSSTSVQGDVKPNLS